MSPVLAHGRAVLAAAASRWGATLVLVFAAATGLGLGSPLLFGDEHLPAGAIVLLITALSLPLARGVASGPGTPLALPLSLARQSAVEALLLSAAALTLCVGFHALIWVPMGQVDTIFLAAISALVPGAVALLVLSFFAGALGALSAPRWALALIFVAAGTGLMAASLAVLQPKGEVSAALAVGWLGLALIITLVALVMAGLAGLDWLLRPKVGAQFRPGLPGEEALERDARAGLSSTVAVAAVTALGWAVLLPLTPDARLGMTGWLAAVAAVPLAARVGLLLGPLGVQLGAIRRDAWELLPVPTSRLRGALGRHFLVGALLCTAVDAGAAGVAWAIGGLDRWALQWALALALSVVIAVGGFVIAAPRR